MFPARYFAPIGVLLVILAVPAMAPGKDLSPVPKKVDLKRAPKAGTPFTIELYKKQWRARIEAIRASGTVPILDIESSYPPGKLKVRRFAKEMDKAGVALIAFSPQVGKKAYANQSQVWTDNARRLMHVDPWRYIPVSTAGIYPAWSEAPLQFLAETISRVEKDGYPLMGEFEFRHYPSPRQYRRGASYRDITIPINGKAGHTLFAFSGQSGIPFQIHYEIEDTLLPPLEEMLKAYPKARVIWCHLAQIRYGDRSTRYNAATVRRLIEAYPNLYFDLAFGGPDSRYPGSNEYQARIWDRKTRGIRKEWVQLIVDHPWRFLAALDLGGDRMDRLTEKTREMRRFLDGLPGETREIVAYKAGWKLLFDEKM